jgi:transcriptional regulator with XRE-family HTH domain
MMKSKKNQKKHTAIEPTVTRVSEVMTAAMEDQGLSIRDLAEKVDVTYEHIRGIVRGHVVPHKFLLKAISDALGLDEHELQKTAVADSIEKKHGKIPLELSGKNPELEPIERAWAHLSPEHKDDLIMMAQTFARSDKAAS